MTEECVSHCSNNLCHTPNFHDTYGSGLVPIMTKHLFALTQWHAAALCSVVVLKVLWSYSLCTKVTAQSKRSTMVYIIWLLELKWSFTFNCGISITLSFGVWLSAWLLGTFGYWCCVAYGFVFGYVVDYWL